MYKIIFAIILRAGNALTSLALAVYVAFKFDSETSGAFLYNLNIIIMIGTIATLGFNFTTIKYTALIHHKKLDYLAYFKFVVRYLSKPWLLFVIFGLLCSLYFDKVSVFTVISIISFSSMLIISAYYQGRDLLILSTLSSGLLVNFSFLISLFCLDLPNFDLDLMYFIVLITSLLFFCITLKFPDGENKLNLDIPDLLKTQRNNLKTTLLNQSLLFGPIVLGGVFIPNEQITEYTLANRFSQVFLLIISAVTLVYIQKFSSAEGDIKEIKKLYLTAMKNSYLSALLALLAVLLLLALSDSLLFSGTREYKTLASVSYVFYILIAAQMVNIFNSLTISMLRVCGTGGGTIKPLFYSTILLIISLPIMVNCLGVVGIAYSVLLVAIYQMVNFLLIVNRFFYGKESFF
ncbi:hypothetical protein [Vibrio crassostreae]|uniref:hypothetical protein n=1 Tax=Vibrio crassostreae TaxID=246167 RepID=UPI001B30E569|nr:hypothetical protein [Vibrio crassostreae]